MFKLIYRDLASLPRKWIYLLVWVSFVSSGKYMMFPVVYLSQALFLVPLILAEKYKTEPLYRSLPVKRSTVVYSKYMSALLLYVVSLSATYLLTLVSVYALAKPGYYITMHNAFAVFFPYVIILSALLPVYFKSGLSLGTDLRSVLVALGLAAVVTALIFLYVFPTLGDVFELKYAYVYLSVGMVMAVAVSLKLSLKFCAAREF